MTPDEALYHIRKDLADAVADVVASTVGQPGTRSALAPYAERLRHARDLDEGSELAEEVNRIAADDPPVFDRLQALTRGVRDQAEAETIPGQLKDAAKKVASGVELIEVGIGLYLLWKIFR